MNKLKLLEGKSSNSAIASDRKYNIPKVELQTIPHNKELKNIN